MEKGENLVAVLLGFLSIDSNVTWNTAFCAKKREKNKEIT